MSGKQSWQRGESGLVDDDGTKVPGIPAGRKFIIPTPAKRPPTLPEAPAAGSSAVWQGWDNIFSGGPPRRQLCPPGPRRPFPIPHFPFPLLMKIVLTWRTLLASGALLFVLAEAHELVHTGLGRLLCGCWAPRDFNV